MLQERENKNAIDTGLLIDTKKMKFAEYLDYWIKEACENKLSITTLDGYKQNIEKHIKTYLGSIELEKIMPLHLQNFYTDRLKNGRLDGKGGLSCKTVVTLHRIIHRALEQAVKWQLIIRNVADNVEPPKPKKYKANFLNEKDLIAVLQKVKNTTDVVLTGRNASQILIDYADLVTDMKEIKHYYKKGIKAKKGLEY